MTRTNRTNMMLLAMVLLLCAGVVAELQREKWLLSRPLTKLNTKRIHHFAVTCEGCRTRRFEMLQGRWWMREPYAMAANPESVARLLAITEAPVRKRRAATEFDPAKLGLAPPQATLTVGELRIDFGITDVLNGDRYVRLRDEIALVPDRFSAWLMAPAESEIEHRLLPAGRSIVQLRIDGNEQPALVPAWSKVETSQVAAPKTDDAASDDAARLIELDLDNGETIRYRLRRGADGYRAVRGQPSLVYALQEAQVQQLLPASGER